MKSRKGTWVGAIATILACSAACVQAATVGLKPSDGVNMFVKAFSVGGGTTITGAEFVNNDDETVFPAIVLVRDAGASLSEGTVVATVANATETSEGTVTVSWSSPVVVSEAGTYYVAVRPPEGAGKQGAGQGPAIGVSSVGAPSGSFIASGADGDLTPIGVDLGISLVTTGGGAGKAGGMLEETPSIARTYLGEPKPNPFNPSTEIEFGLERSTSVVLAIFDASGRRVRVLAAGSLDAGVHRRVWDGRDDAGQVSAAGVYFVRLAIGSQLTQRKLILVK